MFILMATINGVGVTSHQVIIHGGMLYMLHLYFAVKLVLNISQTQIYKQNHNTEGAMYIGVTTGSDKTTVLIVTENVEYYPVYLSIGNLHNSTR